MFSGEQAEPCWLQFWVGKIGWNYILLKKLHSEKALRFGHFYQPGFNRKGVYWRVWAHSLVPKSWEQGYRTKAVAVTSAVTMILSVSLAWYYDLTGFSSSRTNNGPFQTGHYAALIKIFRTFISWYSVTWIPLLSERVPWFRRNGNLRTGKNGGCWLRHVRSPSPASLRSWVVWPWLVKVDRIQIDPGLQFRSGSSHDQQIASLNSDTISELLHWAENSPQEGERSRKHTWQQPLIEESFRYFPPPPKLWVVLEMCPANLEIARTR